MRSFFALLRDNLSHALKSKKALVFLILYLTVFSVVVYGIKELQKEFFQQLTLHPGVTPVFFNLLKEFLKLNSDQFIQALFSIPPYSLQLFAVTLFGTPLLLLLVNYDKLAQEISEGSFRYLLFRTSRAHIYWAKFASMALEIAFVTFIATLLAVLYGHFSLPFFQTAKVFKSSLIFWLAGLPFLVSFSALILLFSAGVKRPFSALLLVALALIASAVVMIWAPQLSPFYLEYWKGFFLPGTPLMLKSVLIYLGFCALFSGVGFLIFKKRDL